MLKDEDFITALIEEATRGWATMSKTRQKRRPRRKI